MNKSPSPNIILTKSYSFSSTVLADSQIFMIKILKKILSKYSLDHQVQCILYMTK